MGFKEYIYNHVPIGMQNAIVSLYGLAWKQRRFGGIFEAELQKYKLRESYTLKDWENYQASQLSNILLHAFQHVPYYRQRWSEAGFNIEKLKSITPATLNQLPFLEKDDLRKYGKTTLIAEVNEPNGKFFASSGTTGTPVSILFSNAMHQRWSAAFEARIRNWAGLTRFDARGMIGGRRIIKNAVANPPYYRYNVFEKQVYFSAYHISENTAANYLEGIRKYKPAYMTGYAVSNFLLASFFNNLELKVPKLKAVITSSEKLTPQMREIFTKVYGCRTYDSYSGVEACSLISECEYGGLHISPDIGIIEFLNNKGESAKPGEQAEMICTGFLNFDQPLIRYRIGDYVSIDDRQCTCGRSMLLVKEIIGRDEDIIVGKDGRAMVRFHGLFIDIPNIIQGQVIQKSLLDFSIKVVSREKLSVKERNIITARIKSQLGSDINAEIEEVDSIPTGPNGKFKAVISELNNIG